MSEISQVIDVFWFSDGSSETAFRVSDEAPCPDGKCFADCGPGATPPCHKWHRDPIPLTALRQRARLTPRGSGEFEWQSPGARQALLALIEQDQKDGVEVGCSAAWRSRA